AESATGGTWWLARLPPAAPPIAPRGLRGLVPRFRAHAWVRLPDELGRPHVHRPEPLDPRTHARGTVLRLHATLFFQLPPAPSRLVHGGLRVLGPSSVRLPPSIRPPRCDQRGACSARRASALRKALPRAAGGAPLRGSPIPRRGGGLGFDPKGPSLD